MQTALRLTPYALLITLLLLPAIVHAHGGGRPQIVAEPVGPYHMFVWTSPDPVREGVMHVTVALARPDSDQPVLDADVRVRVELLDVAAEPLDAPATHLNAANKLTYEVDLDVPAAGLWRVTVAFETPEGSGSAGFDLTVKPPPMLNWLLIGGVGLLLAVAAWLFWPEPAK